MSRHYLLNELCKCETGLRVSIEYLLQSHNVSCCAYIQPKVVHPGAIHDTLEKKHAFLTLHYNDFVFYDIPEKELINKKKYKLCRSASLQLNASIQQKNLQNLYSKKVLFK